MTALRAVCVFCGSSAGADPAYREVARELGGTLARRGLGVVYGGGNVGLMGEVASAALAGRGHVLGVIPRALADQELAHTGCSELAIVTTMHERKALMADRADAFVALPGGLGTLDELFEIATWGQLGIHAKPIGLVNVRGYFDRLLAYLDHAVAEGFLHPAHRALLIVEPAVAPLLDRLAAAPAAPAPAGEGLDRAAR